jgi:serine phosphatase RsbU (regulator of sigma subunit)
MARNFPLGYDGSFNYIEDSCLLGDDEELVLYTDGVTEARNAEGKLMGNQLWIDFVTQGGNLLEAVKRYIGEAEQADDITLMTIYKKSAKNLNS